MRRLPLASLSGLLDRVVGEEEGKLDPWERPSHTMRVHTIAGDGRCMFRATVRFHTSSHALRSLRRGLHGAASQWAAIMRAAPQP